LELAACGPFGATHAQDAWSMPLIWRVAIDQGNVGFPFRSGLGRPLMLGELRSGALE
jgi:hypothetical protein